MPDMGLNSWLFAHEVDMLPSRLPHRLYSSLYVLAVLCLFVTLVVSHFGFEGRTLVLIAPVPSHHYVNVSVLIKFSQKTSVFTLIIISSP